VADEGTEANPARTDADRVMPPATAPGSTFSGGITVTTPPLEANRATSTDQSTTRRSPSISNCFGPPKRWPEPAATTIVQTRSRLLFGTTSEGSTVTQVMSPEQLLANTDFFEGLPPADLSRLLGMARQLDLLRGDNLFHEGDDPDQLFVVVSGRVAIANRSVDGRESVVALMEQGDLFGEMGLLDLLPRSADARALEHSTVLSIPYEPVRQLLTAQPERLWGVVRLLAGRLRAMDEALADSVFLDVTGRTAKRLLELAGDADEFVLPVTQEELAGMVGASRERVNKAIASFIRLGWIGQTDRRYKIIQREKLALRAR
jgi:CRP-like cAMP-binding protein